MLTGERVVVVTHEEVIQEICRHTDPTSSGRKKIPNTSFSVFHVSDSDGLWILEKVGDIGHLNEYSFPQHAPSADGSGASVLPCGYRATGRGKRTSRSCSYHINTALILNFFFACSIMLKQNRAKHTRMR